MNKVRRTRFNISLIGVKSRLFCFDWILYLCISLCWKKESLFITVVVWFGIYNVVINAKTHRMMSMWSCVHFHQIWSDRDTVYPKSDLTWSELETKCDLIYPKLMANQRKVTQITPNYPYLAYSKSETRM